MMALDGVLQRVRPLIERLDGLSLRERIVIFGAGVAVLYVGWQWLLMDPLSLRTRQAEQRLAEARRQLTSLDEQGIAAAQDPAISAALRNHALAKRLAALDAELGQVAQGYVSPERMNDLLRSLLAEQKGLKLVSLANRPVESLSHPRADTGDAARGNALGTSLPAAAAVIGGAGLADTSGFGAAASAPAASSSGTATATSGSAPAADDHGPFLHPVEMVVEGDYASVTAYLRALETLPFRIHWRCVEVTTLEYPVNRVRIDIGALSLSRHWMSV